MENSKLELKIETTDCFPLPQAHWFKDDIEIPSDTLNYTFESTSTEHKLIISNAKESDKGKYTFKIENDLGSAETQSHINILRNFFVFNFLKYNQNILIPNLLKSPLFSPKISNHHVLFLILNILGLLK